MGLAKPGHPPGLREGKLRSNEVHQILALVHRESRDHHHRRTPDVGPGRDGDVGVGLEELSGEDHVHGRPEAVHEEHPLAREGGGSAGGVELLFYLPKCRDTLGILLCLLCSYFLLPNI